MLDLHCHTTYSDGTLSPQELVLAAAKAGLQALAITDHDTIAGWDEAIAAAQALTISTGNPMEIVPGVELSTTYKGRSVHILGFYPDSYILRPLLEKRLEGRRRRAEQMVEKLAELGYPIHCPELDDDPDQTSRGMAPGRPHIARALVKAGYIDRTQDAFDRWIGEGKPAHVAYEELSVEDGLALLKSAGAIPVWAHPWLFRGGNIEGMVYEMAEAGLMGLEVYHPGHTPSQQARLTALCRELGLIKTGGSDYHGPAQDKRHPLNIFNLPLGLLRPLRELKTS
ncbi:MAG: PHP domain-containing protein [Cyanobacteria bacterium P01_F01_bin.150]